MTVPWRAAAGEPDDPGRRARARVHLWFRGSIALARTSWSQRRWVAGYPGGEPQLHTIKPTGAKLTSTCGSQDAVGGGDGGERDQRFRNDPDETHNPESRAEREIWLSVATITQMTARSSRSFQLFSDGRR